MGESRGRDDGHPPPPGRRADTRTRAPTDRSVQISRTTLVRRDATAPRELAAPVREVQLWSQQGKPLLNSVEYLPPNLALPAPAAQHLAPVAFHNPMDSRQCSETS